MNKKTALVTGAASGIGLAVATKLANTGHSLMLVDRSDTVAAVAKQLRNDKIKVDHRVVDVAVEEQVTNACRDTLDLFDSCTILVNCAGISPKGNGAAIDLVDLKVKDWDLTHRINLTAPMLFCRELIPAMVRQQYGRVVNVASRASRMHVVGSGLDYHASKTGLIGLTRALAGIYGKDGITVNAVAPGRVDSPMMKATRPELLQKTLAQIPANRFATTDEIATCIVFLASQEASYVNGTCLDANGGIYMN